MLGEKFVELFDGYRRGHRARNACGVADVLQTFTKN